MSIEMAGTDGELRSLTIARLSDSRYAAAIATARAQVSRPVGHGHRGDRADRAGGGGVVGEGRAPGDDPGRLRQVLHGSCARICEPLLAERETVDRRVRSTARPRPCPARTWPASGTSADSARSGGRCWSMRSAPTRCGCCRRSPAPGCTCSTRTGSCSSRRLPRLPRAHGVGAPGAVVSPRAIEAPARRARARQALDNGGTTAPADRLGNQRADACRPRRGYRTPSGPGSAPAAGREIARHLLSLSRRRP